MLDSDRDFPLAGGGLTAELRTELRDGVAILTLDRPVANALAPSLRRALDEALSDAFANDAVGAVVLQGAGAGFSSGVDITEYDGPLAPPRVGELCRRIEDARKPVVAALHGSAFGAGLELALAAHARVTERRTRLALPDIALGLVPSGGATQRLPRLIGAQAALEFMLSGQAVAAEDPRIAKISDRLVDGDVLPSALDLARGLADKGAWRRTCDMVRGFSDPAGYQRAVAVVSSRLGDGQGAEADLLRCIEAAHLLPFDRGLELEAAVFEDRVATPQARARRHLFTAEKRAAIMPEQGRAGTITPPGRVVLLGGGAIMAELAVTLLDAGKEVNLLAPARDDTAAVAAHVQRIYDNAVARGRLDAAGRDARLGRLSVLPEAAAAPPADMVIDSGGAGASGIAPALTESGAWAVLGTTPQISQRRLDLPTLDGCIVGMRPYRPVQATRLAEVLVPEGARPEAVATLVALFGQMRRTVVRCSGRAGSLGDCLQAALLRGALALTGAGVSPYAVDAAARDLGFAAGPFETADAEGLQVVQARLDLLARLEERSTAAQGSLLAARIASGATGRGAGRGIYVYPEGRDKQEDRAVLAWVEARGSGVSDIDPAVALHAALANEAARLLSDKVAQRASDLDVVAVRGLGFDPERGGPLFRADLSGLLPLLRCMKRLAPLAPDVWTPHPLIEKMVKNGEGFFGRARV